MNSKATVYQDLFAELSYDTQDWKIYRFLIEGSNPNSANQWFEINL